MRKNLLLWGTVACLVACMSAACSKSEREGKIDVVFEVEADNLKPGESVYITGNCPELGDWQPGSVMLDNVSNNLWRLKVAVPYGIRLEYKFTLGSWERESVNPHGNNMANFKDSVVHPKTYRHQLSHWKSEGNPSEFVTGNVKYHISFPGENIARRHIMVWLPPGYDDSTDRYPVLYAHDGQNLFDPYTSYLGTDWAIDEALTELINNGQCEPVIVVGIYNSLDRSEEYGISEKGHAYQKFVVNTLKPMIDKTYRTKPDRDNTATMGSSMGGLVSFLLAWNYPEVFKQAACLSPAFFPKSVEMVRKARSIPDGMRLYMDNGTVGLDQELQAMCDDMMAALKEKGFEPGHPDFMWYLDEGAEHNEQAWAKRVDRPLLFMFGKQAPAATEP